MPYITPVERTQIDKGATPSGAGGLCYQLTKLALRGETAQETRYTARSMFERYAMSKSKDAGRTSWAHYAEVMGAVMGMAAEFKRRERLLGSAEQLQAIANELGSFYTQVIGPYEDTKITENGDVF